MIIILSTVFLISEIPLWIKSDMVEEAHNKVEESDILQKIDYHLKENGFSEYGSVLGYSSLEDINLTFKFPLSLLKEEDKRQIKQIVYSVAEQNGFNPNTFNIGFENLNKQNK